MLCAKLGKDLKKKHESKDEPPVRSEKVEAVIKKVESGEYRRPDVIAAIIERMMSELAKR